MTRMVFVIVTLLFPARTAADTKFVVRRGQIDRVDAVSQLIRLRLAGSAEVRYFFVHEYVRIQLDDKPGDFRLLHERMTADVHVADEDQIVIRVAVYQRTPPPLANVRAGPFDDTAKILRFYPKPNPALSFKKDDELRMAVPKKPFVPLSESEADLDRDAERFAKTIADPKFDVAVKRSPPIVPMATRGKVVRATKSAYEVQIQSGLYRGRTVFFKKEWAYPVDHDQAARKAEELANPPPASKP